MKEFKDPIHQKEDGKWYFWGECWAFEEGSYDTKKEAEKALKEYCEKELN